MLNQKLLALVALQVLGAAAAAQAPPPRSWDCTLWQPFSSVGELQQLKAQSEAPAPAASAATSAGAKP